MFVEQLFVFHQQVARRFELALEGGDGLGGLRFGAAELALDLFYGVGQVGSQLPHFEDRFTSVLVD